MTTKLPTQLTNESEVVNFITELYNNGEFFHLDDNAEDIISNVTNERLFTDSEAEKINELLNQAFDICNVWELPIIDRILDETLNDLQG
jgi:hypothetical protein